MASPDGLRYRPEREEDVALGPGGQAGPLAGDGRRPTGRPHGGNDRGDFPATCVEHLGPARIGAAAPKARSRPLPPTPGGPLRGPAGQAEVTELRLPEQAPLIVARLVEAIEKQGTDNEALYRAPPGSFSNAKLKQALLTDAAVVDLDQLDGQTLAEALRWYLHELPCPVIHPAIYSDLVHTAQETQSLAECGRQAKTLLDSPALPQPHSILLQQLTRHFCTLCQSGSKSRLTPRVLGELFGEVIFRPSAASTEVNPEHHVRILEALLVAEMQPAPGCLLVHSTE